ncbi:SHOCT domain-containing protein [Isoptericola sp. b441]|uniref:SHOCT domain-containing protein n=1 Tax=Actinotalea lenta TaxID=3064654 RepID=A0ABT9D9P7_9CELL|nr:SHOCT domain-containing protein [Isoptericola sp. b441]MDO8106031.1 SHOCT domain-containing protein [Isoptericola sp. b441]
MHIFSSLWDAFWLFFWVIAFIAYLWALVAVISDLFRDRELSGWWKALWLVALIVLPVLTMVVYLIARGQGMARRSAQAARADRQAAEDYLRSVAGTGPATEIARAKELLDAGAITPQEFDRLKDRALA